VDGVGAEHRVDAGIGQSRRREPADAEPLEHAGSEQSGRQIAGLRRRSARSARVLRETLRSSRRPS
jgi:hypothetical protein